MAYLFSCNSDFTRLMGLVPLKGKLKLLRHLFQRDEEGQLSLRFGYKLHELKSLIRNQSSEESPLRSLLKCTDLEQFKNTLDDVIRERCGLKKLGRLFGEAQRTCEQGSASESASCHFGKLPLKVIHRIGLFVAPSFPKNEVNEIIETHLGKPMVKSEEASSSTRAATSFLRRGGCIIL